MSSHIQHRDVGGWRAVEKDITAEADHTYWHIEHPEDLGSMTGFVHPAVARKMAAGPELFAALQQFVEEYCQLVNSGDAGNWDPETEEKVVKARAAIRAATLPVENLATQEADQ